MTKNSYPVILGINYGAHDTSAAIMAGGKLLAACEQERFSLDKHSRLFPSDAIADCLKIGGFTMADVDRIAYGFDHIEYINRTYLETALKDPARIGFLIKDIERIKKVYYIEDEIREKTGFKGQISYYLHHLCHLAATYYASGFPRALLASFDGMGEIDTGLIGGGVDGEITVYDKSNQYPDSLGLIYSAVTFYLGWKHHCDEGIIMGLAPFGDYNAVIPGTGRTYLSVFDEIIQETGKYSYKIDLSWIAYHQERDKWVSDKFKALLGPKRDWHDPLTAHHKNIAAALQKRLETVVLAQLRLARKEFGFNKLALSGGVCLNCSMNGKVEAARIFDEIYVQPASGDNGVCIGACKLAHKEMTGSLKPEKEHNAYLGSRFTNDEIEETLKKSGVKHAKSDDIFTLTAQKLAEGKIVGWFQGAAEFGPRALGNRSILVKPWPADMRDYLNKRVKFREEFRPFAPAVLKERSKEYFQLAQESPHMLIACQVVPAAKDKIPAVVHVDDSCRAQTVGEENNPRFRKLLEAFDKITGCPVILNTSFNVKGQPIVNTPKHALDCFLSTNIDFLALGDFYCEK